MKKTLIGLMVDKKPKPLITYEGVKNLNIDLLLFQPKGIKWSKKKVRGLLFKNGVWKWKTCSFPDAIYNRFYTSDRSTVNKLERVIGKGKVFNCKTRFDKWEIHNILQKSTISNYVPATYLYSSCTLAMLLEKYDLLILKPSIGQLGRGVYLVERTNNEYRLYANVYPQKDMTQELSKQEADGFQDNFTSQPKNNNTTKTFFSSMISPFQQKNTGSNTEPQTEQDYLKEIIKSINYERLHSKIYTTNKQEFMKKVHHLITNRRYLVQQFIPLDKIDQKIYDIRMYVQKDHRGRWTTSGGFSRVGTKNSYLTNLSTELRSINDMQSEKNLLSATALKSMEIVSMLAAKAIESQLGHLGEMSVDFGLDHQGKPWIIEVNGRTQKKLVQRIKDDQLIRTIYLKPIKYAIFLARKSPKKRT